MVQTHSKDRRHTIVTATSNPWNCSKTHICIWVYVEPITKQSQKQSKYPSILDILKMVVTFVAYGCAIGFICQNGVCTLHLIEGSDTDLDVS